MSILDAIKWNADGLVCAVVQDRVQGTVLMQAWMNAEAVQKTLQTGQATFWSRSRQEIWVKGLTSGNTQTVTDLRLDCDGDCLLLQVDPAGPACHTGVTSCFYRAPSEQEGWKEQAVPSGNVLNALAAMLEQRKGADASSSYAASLYAKGREKILQKLGEEAIETVLAGSADDKAQITYEMADLWFHSLVLLADADLSPADVLAELARREGVSGLLEKATRNKGEA
ncbi:MAG: bifunctional phosphoribosyl-AMP cyclohydrolase/phosphoribosyl-ATP diphosphatase HisIE [Oceanococcus sp.]